MAIKIKMELTEEEALAVMHYHCGVAQYTLDNIDSAARIYDIAKRIQRARDTFEKEPETQKAPIAAAWPNS